MKLPTIWDEVRSADGKLEYYQRKCGGFRVMPLYQGRWHACERLTANGWLEFAGREQPIAAMAACGAEALKEAEQAGCTLVPIASNGSHTSAEGAKEGR